MVEHNLDNTQRNGEQSFEVILHKAIQGDEKAFKQLYDQLAGKMFGLRIRYIGNPNDAKDAFQEGFIRVYKNLNAYNGSGVFEGWVRRIFVNTCLDFIKNKKKLLYLELNNYTELPTAADLTGIDKLSKDELVHIIQQLPDGYKLVVNLYLIEGYSHKEISEMLDIAEGTSKSQLSRARLLLQKQISDNNG